MKRKSLILDPSKALATALGQRYFQQITDICSIDGPRRKTARLNRGIVVVSCPTQKVFGYIGPRTHLTGGYVKKVKSVRAAIGEAATGQSSSIDDGNRRSGVAQQVNGKQRPTESAADDYNVKL